MPVVNITNLAWSLPVKTGSLQIFNHRVSNISTGQAGKACKDRIFNTEIDTEGGEEVGISQLDKNLPDRLR